ncbi:hypothetical protein PAXINDRAFT_18994 [Paxillus involutus ATCC 200175]|uniref:Uncharacterized protein n=1 Tax=Paxillus involutus ATCC 200175 TaxID=664439 RepID=A0A0C9TKE5_PAXIN|nr:hypothetical protein PAXINDRAFT_18994 [Paxillus involutus ATCC 200175]
MEARAPSWWSLLRTLLNDEGAQRLGELRMDGEGDVDMASGVPSLEDDSEDYWDEEGGELQSLSIAKFMYFAWAGCAACIA